MSILATVGRAINSAIIAAGDAIVDVLVAGSIDSTPVPGEDYSPSWLIYGGVGFFEKVEIADYVGIELEVSDRQLILMKCGYDVEVHDFVNIDSTVYHVYAVKPELVGSTRVLQKLLLRAEQRTGIPWESGDLATV